MIITMTDLKLALEALPKVPLYNDPKVYYVSIEQKPNRYFNATQETTSTIKATWDDDLMDWILKF